MLNPISKDEYIERVIQYAVDKGADSLYNIRRLLPSDDREESIREMLEAFCFDPADGRAGLLEIYPLSQSKEAMSRVGFRLENWQYDRTAGMLLINLEIGRHESLSAALYNIYKGNPNKLNQATSAERFIDEGLGWFRSSSSRGRALKGKTVKLTFDEKVVFGTDLMNA